MALIVTIFFGFAAAALFSVHFVNYIRGKTTNERFARTNRTASTASELDTHTSSSNLAADAEALLAGNKGQRPVKKGCWLNCKQMCCMKRIISQEELLQMHMTADEDGRTDETSRDSAIE